MLQNRIGRRPPARCRHGRGLLLMKAEVIEIQMPPSPRILIDKPHEQWLSLELAQVHGNSSHFFAIVACRGKYDLFGGVRAGWLNQLHTSRFLLAATNQKAGKRMLDAE